MLSDDTASAPQISSTGSIIATCSFILFFVKGLSLDIYFKK